MSTTRADVLRDLDLEMRRSSGQTVIWSQALASRLGIHPTDLEVLDLLGRYGPVTAGRIAELTGLTTAAVTAVVDRLERRGWAHRRRDTIDRRKVYVDLDLDRAEREVAPLYTQLSAGFDAMATRYTVKELDRIRQFMAESYELLVRETAALRSRE